MIQFSPEMKSIELYNICQANGIKVKAKTSKAAYIAAIEAFNSEIEVEETCSKSSLYKIVFSICIFVFTLVKLVKSYGSELLSDDQPMLNIAQKVLLAMDCNEAKIDVEPLIQFVRSIVGSKLTLVKLHTSLI